MDSNDPRRVLERLIRDSGDDFAALSRMIGKNAAYIQQYLKRGTPKRLAEEDRRSLAEYFGIDQALLGGPVPSHSAPKAAAATSLISVPRLLLGASAGAGSLADSELRHHAFAFPPDWLRNLGVNPAKLSLIRVEGDSMEPGLSDGDDIMVDHRAGEGPFADGVHVIRFDDVLMVKRIAVGPGRTLSIRSDNAHYPSWENVDPGRITVVGKVVWIGRRVR